MFLINIIIIKLHLGWMSTFRDTLITLVIVDNLIERRLNISSINNFSFGHYDLLNNYCIIRVKKNHYSCRSKIQQKYIFLELDISCMKISHKNISCMKIIYVVLSFYLTLNLIKDNVFFAY